MPFPMMLSKCVVFVGIKDADGRFIPKATAFLVYAGDGQTTEPYVFQHLITAEHVIAGMRLKNWNAYCRINLLKGGAEVFPLNDEWILGLDDPHDLTDVAIMPIALEPDKFDVFPLPLVVISGITDANELIQRSRKMQLRHGDEVFVVGLFRHNYGQRNNIPIVRTGNIASLPNEPIRTEYFGGQAIEAFLIEARSISGLSGSPVFANYQKGFSDEIVALTNLPLIGLMHGHFDISNLIEDVITDENGDESRSRDSINTGIGMVIPLAKILQALYQPRLVETRARAAEKRRNVDRGTSR